MTVDPFGASVLRCLRSLWTHVNTEYARMSKSSAIRPRTADEIFQIERTETGVAVKARPTVFKIPERANGRHELYVVVRGWIELLPAPADAGRIGTKDFGTEVGYFRIEDDRLRHVFGAHYDMDKHLPGHPVFHSQVSSQAGLAVAIQDQFGDQRECGCDHVVGLLKNVRMPTPQMDVFSVITQIAADHLISEASGTEVKTAFKAVRAACDFFVGAGRDLTYLNCDATSGCFRSTHWYEGR